MSRVVCRISAEQLRQNFGVLQRFAGCCKLMPVLKYDAYGFGADAIGKVLKGAGAFRFAVADLEEALDVQKLGLDVQILGVLTDDEVPEAVHSGAVLPVCDPEVARKISAEAVKQQRQVRIAVKLDTGMGRLGFIPEESLEAVTALLKLPNIIADGIFSHFSTAAVPDGEFAAFQVSRFKKFLSQIERCGVEFKHIHHAAGDAILKVPESVQPPFNLARPGGVMYGENFTSPCKQIIELSARVGSVRRVKKGSSIGYFRTFVAENDMDVAVIAAGYADGIPLALSNCGKVIIHGEYCPILGRVSMDYTAVDISRVRDEVKCGDKTILLGRDNDKAITVQEWGEMKNTHSHDIWCSLGHRVKRVLD